MGSEPLLDPERLFAREPGALEAYRAVRAMLDGIGPTGIRTTRSQVAFRRRRGFAFLWLPVSWARGADVQVVLTIGLGREIVSTRWKQVAHPAPTTWIHHLEIRALAELDQEVEGWLREAWAAA